MLGPILNGISAAAIVCSILFLQDQVALFSDTSSHAVLILVLTAICSAIQWLWLDRSRMPRTHSGTVDMLVQIHSPSTPDTPSRWAWAGFVSWCLSLITGSVGQEGAASEWEYAADVTTRSRSAHWLEQRRRTDAASALAAGLAAGFGSPFAAVLVSLELGLGGRTLWVVIASLAATLGVRVGCSLLGLKILDLSGTLDGVSFVSFKGTLALIALAVVSGVVSAGFVRFYRFSRQALGRIAPQSGGVRVMAAGVFLFMIVTAHPLSMLPSHALLQDFLSTRIPLSEAAILWVARSASLILILVGFGTVGLFWPVFALGGLFGFAFYQVGIAPLDRLGLGGVPEVATVLPLLALAGATSFWAGILGLPVSASVLVLELTGDVRAAAVCFGAAWISQKVARLIAPTLIEQELESKGLKIVEGRVHSILDRLQVRDAMVTDHETIHEKESISSLAQRLLASRYPFLPVVRADETFTGMVTTDMLQDRLKTVRSSPGVSDLFEVKDLLYRSGLKQNTLRSQDRLSLTQGMFQEIPCVPVIGEDGRVEGLLFAQHVRLSYERELARRSLESFVSQADFPEAVQPLTK